MFFEENMWKKHKTFLVFWNFRRSWSWNSRRKKKMPVVSGRFVILYILSKIRKLKTLIKILISTIEFLGNKHNLPLFIYKLLKTNQIYNWMCWFSIFVSNLVLTAPLSFKVPQISPKKFSFPVAICIRL